MKGLKICFRKRTLVSKKGSQKLSMYLEKHLRDEGMDSGNFGKIRKKGTHTQLSLK